MTGHARFLADGLVIVEDGDGGARRTEPAAEPRPDVDTLHRTLTEATIGRLLTLRIVRLTSLRDVEVTPERAAA